MIHTPAFRCLVFALAIIASVTLVAAERQPTSRYDATIDRYQALPASEQEVWLSELFTQRSQPACRVILDTPDYDRVVADEQLLVEQLRDGEPLSAEEFLEVLEDVDHQEAAVIEKLSAEYERVTQDAVGANLYDFQQRMKLWQAIREQCKHSADPFDAQPMLIWWLDDAITQQRISAAPPMPPVPNFSTAGEETWRRATWEYVPQVQTAFRVNDPSSDTTGLDEKINRYNSAIAQLTDRLYGSKILSVDDLDSTIDSLTSLALVRIGLATNMLNLPADDRGQLPALASIDDAIGLARVKVSAARRQILRTANHDASNAQWKELAGLNRVLQRLDMLATGPDTPPEWEDPAADQPPR